MHNIIRPVLEKYLNDNNAEAICKTHIEKMTNAIADAIETASWQLEGEVKRYDNERNAFEIEIGIQGKALSGCLEIKQTEITKERPKLPEFQIGNNVQITVLPVELDTR